MVLDIGVLGLMMIGMVSVGILYISEQRLMKQETILIEKMRNSEFYQDLSEIILRCRKRYVEQVRIKQDCIEILLMVPAGRRIVYSLGNRGHRSLSAKRQRTLSLLMGQDMPVLMDRNRYTLHKEKWLLPNGEKAVEYVFTMKIGYKNALNRMPYYMQS